MMSASLIKSISDHAAYRAAEEEREPLNIWDAQQDAQHIPFLGSYVPEGWRAEGEPFMVDSSGFGSPGEPAMTFDQFVAHLETHPGLGWAIVEQGQFQIVVQAYAEDASAPGSEAPEPERCDDCGEAMDPLDHYCEPISRCPACGDVIDYCQGHGEIGDPEGHAILEAHDADDHAFCHIVGCDIKHQGQEDPRVE